MKRTNHRTASLLLLALSIPCMRTTAQVTETTTDTTANSLRLFTLEDLNYGGNNYWNLTPENKYTTWWGDKLVRTDVEECYLVDTQTGEERLLFTLSGNALAQNQPTDINPLEDSDSWKAFTKDSLTVLMDIHPIKLQGKWLQIEICFANNSDSTYRFTMEDASIECEKGRIPFLSEELFSKKVRHRKCAEKA